jgi:chloride channel 2
MMHGIQGGIPFMMDDDKMLNLLRQGWPIEKRQLLDKMINITYGNICHVKPLTMTISSTTPLENIHMIFTMLRCDHCFVCDQGELLGVVTTKALLRAGSHIETN